MKKLFPLLLIVLFMGCSAPFFSAKTVDQVCDYAREACDIWDTLWVFDTIPYPVYYADCMPSGAPYTIYFAENSAELPNMPNTLNFLKKMLPAEKVLYEALSIMELCETVDMMITGHCDDRLSEAYNDSLSFERGKSVMKWFIDRGIPNFRMIILPKGESEPVATVSYPELGAICDTMQFKTYDYSADNMRQEIWRLNRRAEIKILK